MATTASVVIAVLGLGGCGSGSGTSTGAVESFGAVPGSPFGVVTTPDGRYAFVDLIGGRVLVYSVTGLVPHLIRTIPVPGEAVGSSLTRDGRLLVIASGKGATVLSVERAESGAPHPVLGTLSPPRSARLQAAGAIETTTSADGRYVFVSLEYGAPGGAIAVYDLGSPRAPTFGPGDYVGAITLGSAVVGSAVSPNGRYLYVTSELGRQSPAQVHAREQRIRRFQLRHRSFRAVQGGGLAALEPDGTLSVISVATAEHNPARAVLATVPALRQPVRVAVSPDGSIVWVTARASDRLLAFSTARLLSNPARALLANVTVGTAPVGVAVFDHGDRVIIADSNRFNAPGAHATLTIVNTRAALTHHPAVIATLRAGRFPREIAVERNDTVVLVSNFASDQLESVNVSRLR
jgi:DNA-binding beta-propeller fold protein YncE